MRTKLLNEVSGYEILSWATYKLGGNLASGNGQCSTPTTFPKKIGAQPVLREIGNSPNGARLLVRGLVKRPGKARPDGLSNNRL